MLPPCCSRRLDSSPLSRTLPTLASGELPLARGTVDRGRPRPTRFERGSSSYSPLEHALASEPLSCASPPNWASSSGVCFETRVRPFAASTAELTRSAAIAVEPRTPPPLDTCQAAPLGCRSPPLTLPLTAARPPAAFPPLSYVRLPAPTATPTESNLLYSTYLNLQSGTGISNVLSLLLKWDARRQTS